jgi:hypothetical protein
MVIFVTDTANLSSFTLLFFIGLLLGKQSVKQWKGVLLILNSGWAKCHIQFLPGLILLLILRPIDPIQHAKKQIEYDNKKIDFTRRALWFIVW